MKTHTMTKDTMKQDVRNQKHTQEGHFVDNLTNLKTIKSTA